MGLTGSVASAGALSSASCSCEGRDPDKDLLRGLVSAGLITSGLPSIPFAIMEGLAVLDLQNLQVQCAFLVYI